MATEAPARLFSAHDFPAYAASPADFEFRGSPGGRSAVKRDEVSFPSPDILLPLFLFGLPAPPSLLLLAMSSFPPQQVPAIQHHRYLLAAPPLVPPTCSHFGFDLLMRGVKPLPGW